ncbi:MAG: bifunctional 4-hydroxy-2-oxoglutarate aldolase/2-dehydro-3-deoxy-phosphogluconate aldolase [Candidatus Margulisiibacteriota bacterium]
MNIELFRKLPIIGIIRNVPSDSFEGTIEAAITGGLTTIEITLNTPGALKLIKTVACKYSTTINLGAGTVCTLAETEAAISAGASFIVSPLTDLSMIAFCKEKNIPIFPGALTPTEIYNAYQAGATMIKVFPVSIMGGPEYIKQLKGPFDNIQLLACGGVRPGNLAAHFKAGASAVAVGNTVFNPEWMLNEEYNKISESAHSFVEAYNDSINI